MVKFPPPDDVMKKLCKEFSDDQAAAIIKYIYQPLRELSKECFCRGIGAEDINLEKK